MLWACYFPPIFQLPMGFQLETPTCSKISVTQYQRHTNVPFVTNFTLYRNHKKVQQKLEHRQPKNIQVVSPVNTYKHSLCLYATVGVFSIFARLACQRSICSDRVENKLFTTKHQKVVRTKDMFVGLMSVPQYFKVAFVFTLLGSPMFRCDLLVSGSVFFGPISSSEMPSDQENVEPIAQSLEPGVKDRKGTNPQALWFGPVTFHANP